MTSRVSGTGTSRMSGTGPEAGEPAPRVPAHPGPASVLIVDDDRWTTRAIAAALSDDGTLTVLDPRHSGEDAVEAFIRFRPDLVLMDVNMPPGMSGVDATAQIIEVEPSARIVLLTTVSPGPGIARALEAGALAAVNKTASDAELVGVVKAALGGDSPALLRSLAADIVLSGDPLPEAPEAAPVLTDKELILPAAAVCGHGLRRDRRGAVRVAPHREVACAESADQARCEEPRAGRRPCDPVQVLLTGVRRGHGSSLEAHPAISSF